MSESSNPGLKPATEGAAESSSSHGPFTIGDNVKFVRSRAVGSSIEFKTMEGKIIEFSKPKGIRALIKYHGGNYVWKRLTDIRRIDQPSPLKAIIGMENDSSGTSSVG